MTNFTKHLFKYHTIFLEESHLMTSNKSAQLHVTFDVRDKHGSSFTYGEIQRKVFDIFIISFDNCMHYMFMQKGDYLFYSEIASIII